MTFWKEYSGKLILNYQTRSEQLAIDKLYKLLKVSPIEDLVYILDGYDAREAAKTDPGWSIPRKENHDTESD